MSKSSSFAKCENNILTLGNALFSHSIENVDYIEQRSTVVEGLSASYLEVTAKQEQITRRLCVWNELPVLYMPERSDGYLLSIAGEHWTIQAIKLNAFTDDNDTLTHITHKNMFARNLFGGAEGDIFFLEDPQSGNAVVIISETPDYQRARLEIKDGAVSVVNGNNPLALGFCKIGECEALCRDYYRHARLSRGLITMSNTWGDCHGFSRVCRDFVLREIDAAREIGVDIVQIDDGWQTGSTADLSRRDEKGRREFKGDFWDLDMSKFPEGMKEIADYAAKDGIRVGLWFAPDSHDGFALLERDVSVLKRAYDEWGVRFFKLDMFWVLSDTDRDQFLKLLSAIYSFGDDVAVQLDVTRNARMNYLCGRQYGTVFVENRYAKSGNFFPHRVLRNLWSLSRYLPTSKFQFELINPDLYAECYSEGDPFVPSLYSMDYLFATVMLSNPLFWMEMQFLNDERREQLKGIMDIWKSCRERLAGADVMPIGQMPSGRNFTGFYVAEHGVPTYLLVFRELNDRDSYTFTLPSEINGTLSLLKSNGSVSATACGNNVTVSFSAPRTYAFFAIE